MQAACQRNSYSNSTRATENRGAQPLIRTSLEIERLQIANAVHDPQRPARVALEAIALHAAIASELMSLQFGPATSILDAWIEVYDRAGFRVARVTPRVCVDQLITFYCEDVHPYYSEVLEMLSKEGIEEWARMRAAEKRRAAGLAETSKEEVN